MKNFTTFWTNNSYSKIIEKNNNEMFPDEQIGHRTASRASSYHSAHSGTGTGSHSSKQ